MNLLFLISNLDTVLILKIAVEEIVKSIVTSFFDGLQLSEGFWEAS